MLVRWTPLFTPPLHRRKAMLPHTGTAEVAAADAVGVEVVKVEEEVEEVQEEVKVRVKIEAKEIQEVEVIEVKGVKEEEMGTTHAMGPLVMLTCPHSKPVNAIGPLAKVLFSVLNQHLVLGRISTLQDLIIEVLTSSAMNIKNLKYKI